MSNMQIEEQTKRVTILTLTDRLDAFNSSTTRAEIDILIQDGATHFVVDLTGLTFMDSAGIAVLINLFKRVRPLDGTVKLVRPTHPTPIRILHLTKFNRLFDMFDTVDEATQSF